MKLVVSFVSFLPVLLTLIGCAGATPNLSPPQMQNQPFGNSGRNQSTAEAIPDPKPENLPQAQDIPAKGGVFYAPPYVQFLPVEREISKTTGLLVTFHQTGLTVKNTLAVQWRLATSTQWSNAKGSRVGQMWGPSGMDAHIVVRQELTGLPLGTWIDYRVLDKKEVVFQARCKTRPANGQAQRVIIFGDCGSGMLASRQIAAEASKVKADYTVLTGDIVYSKGRGTEYQKNFWPVFNADVIDPAIGGPLLRSTPTITAPGNHDVRSSTLDKFQDAFAYFIYWSMPKNGYAFPEGSPSAVQLGSDSVLNATFRAAAANQFPNGANYSMTVGDVHWTILDANPNVDWADPPLLAWLEADLAAASKTLWRFVVFHHPPFNSSLEHFDNQWMRLLSETFHKHKVQMVWNGHVHNYQRTLPLVFHPTEKVTKKGTVDGTFDLDAKYDALKGGKPNGQIYVITGAGGASLYKKYKSEDGKPQKFTSKMVNDIHSFTIVEINPTRLSVKQVDAEGKEIDTFIVQREESK